MIHRTAEVERGTLETDVRVRLDLDGEGHAQVATGIGFLDHMLTLLARHSHFDLTVEARGDRHVDDHHTTEDVGIVLGNAIRDTLGDKRGIARYGWAYAPMDEALVRSALDLSGRPYCVYEVPVAAVRVGTFDTELVEHFCHSFAMHAHLTLHVDLIRGRNTHHILEAVFKSLALALHQAVSIMGDELPTTKGDL